MTDQIQRLLNAGWTLTLWRNVDTHGAAIYRGNGVQVAERHTAEATTLEEVLQLLETACQPS